MYKVAESTVLKQTVVTFHHWLFLNLTPTFLCLLQIYISLKYCSSALGKKKHPWKVFIGII